jgi:hypothetical protein
MSPSLDEDFLGAAGAEENELREMGWRSSHQVEVAPSRRQTTATAMGISLAFMPGVEDIFKPPILGDEVGMGNGNLALMTG